MDQKIKVNLVFTSDTKQAKQGMKELQQELTQLTNTKLRDDIIRNLNNELGEAATNVRKFQALLQSAVNVDTGRLDVTKLNASLKTAGTSLNEVSADFAQLGSEGVMAFSNVVKQINNAEIPLKKTNALVDKLWTALKNTVTWQISSSITTGFIKAVSSAYGYAQDLNESLNNIRIVTESNTDEMAKFAKQANAAAKALSTTTLDYTNASLIYFQQGDVKFFRGLF